MLRKQVSLAFLVFTLFALGRQFNWICQALETTVPLSFSQSSTSTKAHSSNTSFLNPSVSMRGIHTLQPYTFAEINSYPRLVSACLRHLCFLMVRKLSWTTGLCSFSTKPRSTQYLLSWLLIPQRLNLSVYPVRILQMLERTDQNCFVC